MVSLEGLTKVVDPSQLTADFDGSLDYNHEEWIEVRQQRERLGLMVGAPESQPISISLQLRVNLVIFWEFERRNSNMKLHVRPLTLPPPELASERQLPVHTNRDMCIHILF